MGVALVAIPVGIIVSRVVHILDKLGYYRENPRAIFSLEGMTIYGAILGGLLAAWIYCRLKRVTFAPLADLAAPGVILAQAIGRVGCILNGCCTGKETSVPWAFVYTNPLSQANMYDPVTGQVVSALYLPLHPTHLYELVGDLVIFVLLFWVFRGRLKPDGSLFALYLALYSAVSFTVRFWRGDTEPLFGFLPEGQIIAVITFVGSVAWMVVNRTHWVGKQKEPDVGEAETKASVGGNAGQAT
jgi:phosphatidylglycerol:prolipoprotein diacylglycerol transferase